MQNLIVAAIVLYASWIVLKRYLPRAVKLAMIAHVASGCAAIGLRQLAMRLRTMQGAMPQQSGCSSCDSCSPASATTTSSATSTAALPAASTRKQEAHFSITPEELKKTIRRR